MPKLKRNVKNAPDRTGFETYDGPEPRKGVYRGIVKSVKLREASTGTLGFNVLVELEARPDSENKKYDGFPAWVNIWLADKEANLAREKQFYRAVGAKQDEPVILHDELDDGGKINKIGGKDPIGAVVKVDMKSDTYEGETRVVGDAVYPVDPEAEKAGGKRRRAEPEPEPEDDDDLMEDEEEVDEDEEPEEEEEEEERPDYANMSLPALRKAAREAGIDTKGKSKPDLIDELVDAWGDSEDEEPEEEEEEEEPEEETGPAVKDARGWKLPALKKFAREEGGYSNEDLKGLKSEEIIEMLVEDEALELGDEPPF